MKSKQPHRKAMKKRPGSNMLFLLARPIKTLTILTLLSVSLLLFDRVSAEGQPATVVEPDDSTSTSPGHLDSSKSMPANHRMELVDEVPTTTIEDNGKASKSRHGRQYDTPMSGSSTGNYAAVSGDAGAYVGSNLPMAGYSPVASNAAMLNSGAYAGAAGTADPSSIAGYPSASAYHEQMPMARGYPSMHAAGGYLPMSPFGSGGGGGGGGALAAMFPGGPSGFFSPTGSSGFPLMSKGFDIAEIVCTAIAVAIGAVIVGAPFILLYLFVMNQMQGNGPNALGPGGGSISLTGPTASTNVGGRKKRHTSFSEALFKQFGPLVNNEQVAQTFKMLMNSIAKYQA